MRKSIGVAGLVLSAVGAVVAAPDSVPGFFITNDAAHPVPMVEQNLDPAAGNAIRVHEQGTIAVNVTNGAVPVQVAELRVPMQETMSYDDWGTERYRNFDIDVPEGKLLVLETVSVSATVESGQRARVFVSLQSVNLVGPGFEIADHMLTLERVEGFGSGDVYATTRSLAGYASGEGGVSVSVERNATTGAGGQVKCSVTGYLIDIPTE